MDWQLRAPVDHSEVWPLGRNCVSADPHPLPGHPASTCAAHPGIGLEAFVTGRLRVRGLAHAEMEALGFPKTQVLIYAKAGL